MHPTWRDKLLATMTGLGRRLPKGRTTLHRSAWQLLGRPERYLGRLDGQWFQVDARDRNIAVHTIVHGSWEDATTALWKHLLAPGMTVVDVGANKGFFSLLAARRVFPGGRVISYEPMPGNAQDIEATASVNRHPHWTVRYAALSGERGTAMLHTPVGADGSGWGSLERVGADVHSVEVELVRLDDDLTALGASQVHLLKMDIQGHELDALRGARSSLERGAIHSLLVEVHRHILGEDRVRDVWQVMGEVGYRGRLLDEGALSTSQWREVASGQVPFDAVRCLVPVSGPDDPRLPAGNWYKILWEAPAAT
jgi:FkbM family methyltransferase